jgi:hypothetical protein
MRASVLLSTILAECLITCTAVLATNRTYVGGAGTGNWSAPGNWSPAGAPQDEDNCSLIPADSLGRTVVFDVNTGSLLHFFGNVVVAPIGSGTIALLNPGHVFDVAALSVGAGGAYQQQQNGAAFIGSTLLNGGTMNVSGPYGGDNFTMTSGTFTMGGTLTLSGTFNYAGGRALFGDFVNNGTLLFNNTVAPQGLAMLVYNHGTIVMNADGTFIGLTNFVSMTLPANRSLSMIQRPLQQSAGTFTEFGNVDGTVEVAGGTWDQRGGTCSGFFGVGLGATGPGTYLISAGTVSSPQMQIGIVGAGTFIQSGGSVIADEIQVAATPGARGRYNISGGTISTPSLTIGATNSSDAVFSQTGGLVGVLSTFGDQPALVINDNVTSNATLSISGGTFQVTGSTPALTFVVNHGFITQSGGTSNIPEIVGAGSISLNGTASMTLGGNVSDDFFITLGRIRQDRVQLAGNAHLAQVRPAAAATPLASRVHSLIFDEAGGTVHGAWDLGGSPLIIDYTESSPISAATRYVRSGFAGGHWNGTGMNSSIAAADPSHITALGVAEAADLFGAGGGSFGGVAVDGTAVLIKYTWYGDADLNGRVNFDDYVRIDNGFNNHRSGWTNGDFDYNGQINFDDYVLIDLAFNTQNGTLGRALSILDGGDDSTSDMHDPALQPLELHFAEFGSDYASHFLAAVPEPSASAVIGGLLLPVLSGRRRRT